MLAVGVSDDPVSLARKIGAYITFKKDLLYRLIEDYSRFSIIISDFRREQQFTQQFTWKEIDDAIGSSNGLAESPFKGSALRELFGSEATFEKDFLKVLFIDYKRSYNLEEISEVLKIKDEEKRNVLHRIAENISSRVDRGKEVLKKHWEVYDDLSSRYQFLNEAEN